MRTVTLERGRWRGRGFWREALVEGGICMEGFRGRKQSCGWKGSRAGGGSKVGSGERELE
ncbi:MAG: hypothetical protein GY820_21925 [Gammaproteobacteria bacterium]|nr:hypothetical protein [Gammaproteobacteria bacterium]